MLTGLESIVNRQAVSTGARSVTTEVVKIRMHIFEPNNQTNQPNAKSNYDPDYILILINSTHPTKYSRVSYVCRDIRTRQCYCAVFYSFPLSFSASPFNASQMELSTATRGYCKF